MAEEPARIVRLDTEVEGDIQSTSDFVFRRIGEAAPLLPSGPVFDLHDPPLRPLAASDRFATLFLAHSQGFLVVRTKDAIEVAKEVKEKGAGPCVSDSSEVDVRIGKVSIIALSGDSLMLAATVGGDVHFFSVPSLVKKKEQKPSFSCSGSRSGIVRDFKWQGSVALSYVILSNNGSLYHGRLKEPLKDVMNDVDAVDCCAKGNCIAVARKSILSILSSDFKEQLCLSLLFESWSDATDSGCTIKVDSIGWVRDDSIIVGCVRLDEDGNEEGYLVHVVTSGGSNFFESPCEPVVFSFPFLFGAITGDILPRGGGPDLILSYLNRWELLLSSNRKNTDQHVVLLKWSCKGSTREVVSLECLSDKYFPRIDLQDNGVDNVILGFGVEMVSLFERITIEDGPGLKELSPQFILLCLTCEGKLIMYHVARVSDPSDLPPSTVSANEYDDTDDLSTPVEQQKELAATVSGQKVENRFKEVSIGSPRVNAVEELRSDGASPGQKKVPVESSQSKVDLPYKLEATLASRDNFKSKMLPLDSSLPGKSVSATLTGSNMSSELAATWLASGSDFASCDLGKGVSGSTQMERVLTESQSTVKVSSSNNLHFRSSAFTSDGSVLAISREKEDVGRGNKLSASQDRKASVNAKARGSLGGFIRDLSSKALPDAVSEAAGYMIPEARTENVGVPPISRGSFAMPKEDFSQGKLQYARAQPLLDNSRNSKAPQMLFSEQELSKKFYNVDDMAKELDMLLFMIENKGGYRDACTVLHQDSLLALEKGLQNLSESSWLWKRKMEEQLIKIQDLRSKMSRVSARQVYMEGIVNQSSNSQYWDIWSHQKLSPEFELKRENILRANQNLTNQLVELERHFNNLEINRFGAMGGVASGRRALYTNIGRSRQTKSLHSLYNTLNSQISAAEQLSESLSKQMTLLNISSPSVKRGALTKELFESIGLVHENDAFQSPDVTRPGPVSNSRRMTPSSLNDYRMTRLLGSFKSMETGSARRESFNRSWTSLEPQKITVKRTPQKQPLRISSDKAFRLNKETFDYRKESATPQKNSSTTSFVESSLSNLKPQLEGTGEKPSRQAVVSHQGPQQDVFKCASDYSGLPQHLELKPQHLKEATQSASQPPKLTAPENQPVVSTAKILPIPKPISYVQAEATQMASGKASEIVLPPTNSVSVQAIGGNSKSGGDSLSTTLSGGTNNLDASLHSLIGLPREGNKFSLSSASAIQSNVNAKTPLLKGLTDSEIPAGILSTTTDPAVASSTSSLLHTSSSSLALPPTTGSAFSFGRSSLGTKTGHSVSSLHSTSAVSTQFLPPAVPSQKSISQPSPPVSEGSGSKIKHMPTLSSAAIVSTQTLPPVEPSTKSMSELLPSISASSVSPPSLAEDSSEDALKPGVAISQEAVTKASVVPISDGKTASPSLRSSSLFPTDSATPVPSTTTLSVNSIATGKEDSLDATSSEEDEMEEEDPDTSTDLNLGALGGFGFGSATSPQSQPKSNPFGASFTNTSSASSPFTLTATPGMIFRPASLAIPSAQLAQSSHPTSLNAFANSNSGGLSGFGQPAQIGAGQQTLGSVLGSFGQSRQFGTGVQGIGFGSSSGFGAGGFSSSASGGFGGFASPATGGGFAASSGAGFAGAATGGGFAAAAASVGGGFAGAGAGAGGGFAAVASKSGGFAGAASAGGGFGVIGQGGGFMGGGFGGFSSNQVSGFSAFGGGSAAGPGRPPSDLLTQMRK